MLECDTVTRIGDAIHILKVLIGDQEYIRKGCILMHTGGSRGCSTI